MRTSHTVVLFVLAVAASTAALQWFLRDGEPSPPRALPLTPRVPPTASGGYPAPSAPPGYGAPSPFSVPSAAPGPPPPASFPVGQPDNPRYGTAPASQDPRAQTERQDFGVPPTSELHAGAMHGPTPASIPGGQVVTTPGLIALLGDRSLGARVFDVLGGPETLPGALAAVPASQPGNFQDPTQQQFGQFLQQTTQGRRDLPLVFYCASSHCWMSYNAALRAIGLGYTNVLWYRGGLEAWQAAGQPTQRPPQAPGAPARPCRRRTCAVAGAASATRATRACRFAPRTRTPPRARPSERTPTCSAPPHSCWPACSPPPRPPRSTTAATTSDPITAR